MDPAAPLIRVDRTSPVPLYFQVAQHLEHLIESGELATGTRLENEVNLAGRAGLSRPTIRRAIEYLVDRGLLIRKRGVGTQVTHARLPRQVELTSLYEDLAQARRDPRTRVLSFTAQPAPEPLALELGVPPGTPVYAIERLRSTGAEPLALLRNHLPVARLRLTPDDLESHGLYQLLRAAGISLRMARQSIGARAATGAQARALGDSRGAPLLTMTRTAYDEQGHAVEHGSHLYRSSRYNFDLTLNGW